MAGLISGQSSTVDRSRRLLWIAALLVAAALLLAMLSGFGHRWGWWHFRTGFQLLRWAVYMAIAGGLVALLTILLSGMHRRLRDIITGGMVVLVAIVIIMVPVQWLNTARSVPPIHDITTDMTDPPAFEAILPLRADAPNPSEYAGEEVAAQQRAAYPGIRPLDLDHPYHEVFAVAVETVRAMGWDIIAADPERGRIEAVATTFWYGFRDDVVIRIATHDGVTRVDMRSLSRVGRSDVGANARRISTYLARLTANLG